MNFYIFFLKLSTILNKPKWGHGILIKSMQTTANNTALSLALYDALIHVIGDNHLLPFVNNETFRGKGLEMLGQFFMEHGGFTGNKATEMLSEFNLSKNGPDESLDNAALRLCTYSTKLNTMSINITDTQLTHVFVYGLCDNFREIKCAHDMNTLNWRPQGLAKALMLAKGIKCNLASSSNWVPSSSGSVSDSACATSILQDSSSTSTRYGNAKPSSNSDWLKK
eukprot:14722205-Ditylum_brightwellii.AAC.1